MEQSSRPVFEDLSGKRWRITQGVMYALCTGLFLILAALVWSIVEPPQLPKAPLRHRVATLQPAPAPQAPHEPRAAPVAENFRAAQRYGFYVNWDDNSFVSLKRNAAHLDVLAPEFLHLAGADQGEEVTVQDAWRTAKESEASLRFDQRALNPAFSYAQEDGARHTVWFLDAASAYNQTAAALALQPAGIALWRLGSEDPGVWGFFGRNTFPNAPARTAMQTMHAGYDLVYDGDGEALKVTGAAKSGARAFTFSDGDNLITDETIASMPDAVTLTRWGASNQKLVALTFDDGPDPAWTPAILDALKAAHAPATFFLIGGNALAHPDLLHRIVAEGHDIGSHSFTHPNISELPNAAAEMELNSTERTFEALEGVRPLLFRPPYAEDIEPETIDDARIVDLASRLGYVTLGLRVDPNDWRQPGVQTIVDDTVAQIERGEGHVVLLHDSGGDRSQTVAAIPQMVARLRADGYRFVTAHELLGLPRAALMAPTPSHAPNVALSATAVWAVHGAESLIAALFVIGLVLGFGRFAIIGVLALTQVVMRRRAVAPAASKPRVSVIVPAYNEERVIIETVRSILTTQMTHLDADAFEILVIDDGSSDATAAVARHAFDGQRAVRVIRKANGGKASAINFGVDHAVGDIIVVIDADTVLEPDAIGLLARHFADPAIGAIAGNAKVGNRINWITRFQALEYITSQNLDRRAFEVIHAIGVVPGAIGAWRRSALQEIGGFKTDTLAEDADATIALQRAGWRVLYQPGAIARTEAPEKLPAFLKQRFRWMYGTLQAAFKHRDAPLKPGARRFGWTLLPNVVIFQILFPLISPVMDALLVASAVSAGLSAAMHAGLAPTSGLQQSLFYYGLFQAIELGGAALGFALDRGEDWRLLPLTIAQRFCYRQLLYLTALRALAAALRGQIVGWGKLQRSARVKMRPRAGMGAKPVRAS
jgi:peptidoglycan-N-acetylglucosamine deacetylase